jgi:hypothetical protein
VIDASVLLEIHLIHYIVATMTLLLAVFWLLFYRDSPPQHKWVDGIEQNKIATGKIQVSFLKFQLFHLHFRATA